jgi:hypothetical protein
MVASLLPPRFLVFFVSEDGEQVPFIEHIVVEAPSEELAGQAGESFIETLPRRAAIVAVFSPDEMEAMAEEARHEAPDLVVKPQQNDSN